MMLVYTSANKRASQSITKNASRTIQEYGHERANTLLILYRYEKTDTIMKKILL